MAAPNALTTETTQSSAPPQDAPAPPAYFLSLTVENFRCFGPAQTLDLSRGENRPAPWTIILGENGVGKTTLLQCLAAFQPQAYNLSKYRLEDDRIHFAPNRANLDVLTKSQGTINVYKENITLSCDISAGDDLKTDKPKLNSHKLTVRMYLKTEINGDFVAGFYQAARPKSG